MTPWLVLPVKSVAHGKSRLAGRLDEDTRRQLNLELLERSLELAARYPGSPRTVVVSPCREVLALARVHGARVLQETGAGLNAAVAQAVDQLAASGDPILVMSCDLPFACEADLRALVRPDQLVLATDRLGAGTNALGLPGRTEFRFHYGESSRYRHAEEAARRGLAFSVLQAPSLAFDLDTFEDYREWRRQQETSLWSPPVLSGGRAPPASPAAQPAPAPHWSLP